MKVWRFFVPPDNAVPVLADSATLVYAGCLAVVVAEDEAAARSRLVAWAATSGADIRWLEIAQVRELEITEGALLAFVMF